jgi:hypothetical protein
VLAWLRLMVTFVTYVLATLAVYVVIRHGVVWGTGTWNDLRYGFPRTTQVSGVVGHSDSVTHPSHLIALNLNGQVSVWEIPGGDTSAVRVLADHPVPPTAFVSNPCVGALRMLQHKS